MHAMLPSPATERTKSKNIPLDLQLTSCEAQRDLVFARVREPLNQRNHRRGSQNRHFETPQELGEREAVRAGVMRAEPVGEAVAADVDCAERPLDVLD